MTPDKRYQVFVSSTYTDLLEARAEVMQALLELDCMPAGMELFPAANQDQWNWIKRVIEESDYYLVILAGRYGSISAATAQSYTEMEYRYALEIGKPVIGFLHDDPSRLPAKHYEAMPEARQKLDDFRALVKTKLCKFWSSPADLGAKVSRSLTQLIKQHPAVGWMRADAVTPDAAREVLALRRQVEELQSKLAQLAIHGPEGTETLAQGKDKFSIGFVCQHRTPRKGKGDRLYWVKVGNERATIDVTWDDLFAHLAPNFITPARNHEFIRQLNELVSSTALPQLEKRFPGDQFADIRIYHEYFDTIKIQLRALGLIAAGDQDSWVLTEYGDAYMNKLLAVHRRNLTPRSTGRGRSRRST